MISLKAKSKKLMTLEPAFDNKSLNKMIIKKVGTITEDITNNVAYLYLGKEKDYKCSSTAIKSILACLKRDYQVDVSKFINQKITENCFVKCLVEKYIYKYGELYSLKTKKEENKSLLLINTTKEGKESFEVAKIEAETRNWSRGLQLMPPNILNSENYATMLKDEFTSIEGISVKVLTEKEAKKMNMGLFLGVNRGSEYKPRIVVLEYKGEPRSKEKIGYVGKGIMFDSGGYSLKPARSMLGMKYDMSGTAVIAGAMKLIAHFKPKKNVVAVLMLTDNSIGKTAQKPDSVCTSMNGKTVEINNTDAEGRLALADGLTYAIRKCKVTKVLDAATLTGAVTVALGETYTGVWATNDKDWKAFSKAAKIKCENVWRLPLHEDFANNFIRKSNIADLKNTDLTGKGGSNSAAMFLKEFVEDVDYIHCDIGSSAAKGEEVTGPLVKTLAELANHV